MRRLTGVVVVVVVMVVVSGCATQMNVQQQAVQIAGKPFTYVMAEGKDPSGVNFVVMDRYDGEGKLVSRDAASGNGILHAVIPAVIDGAATAGGLIGAASVLRPDTTNVTQTTGGMADAGASAGSGSGSGGNNGSGSSGTTTITVSPTVTTSSTASPVATSSSKSTATAASASNQSQSQSQTATSSNTNSNSNTNTNTSNRGGKTKTHTNHGHHYGHDKNNGDK